MATVKFFIKGTHNPSTLYVRLRDGRNIDISASTNLSINPEYWNSEKKTIRHVSKFKSKKAFEDRLRNLESLIYEERNTMLDKGLPVSKEWLKNLINIEQGRKAEGVKDYLIDAFENYKALLPHRVRNNKKGVSYGSIRNYNTSIQRLKKFEQAKGKAFRLIEIDLTFHDNYIKFASEKLGLSINSIGKDIKQIKTVCLDAKDNGVKVNDQVLSRKFNAPSEPSVFTTINPQELELLSEYRGKNYMENARDWLVIGCWTGCRVGDLMKLTKKNIIKDTKGRKIIQYTQSKTGKLVNVPMHEQVDSIMNRLNGFPRPISSVKFNQYIKEVCKAVGMTYIVEGTRQNPITHLKEVGSFEKWELIKSHTCRRSFATNHYNKLSNKVIMAVTGHATEKMLLNYIGETEIDHVDDFFDLWSQPQNKTINKLKNG